MSPVCMRGRIANVQIASDELILKLIYVRITIRNMYIDIPGTPIIGLQFGQLSTGIGV